MYFIINQAINSKFLWPFTVLPASISLLSWPSIQTLMTAFEKSVFNQGLSRLTYFCRKSFTIRGYALLYNLKEIA